MYHVSAQGVDERMINVRYYYYHYYYYYYPVYKQKTERALPRTSYYVCL